VIAAVCFALGVLSALSTGLALFTPRRPLILGWLAWVIGLVPCEAPRAALVLNLLLLGVSVAVVPLDAALGIAGIALLAVSLIGDLLLVRRSRAADPVVGRALRTALGEDFEQEVDPDLAPVDDRPVSPLREAFAPFSSRRRPVERIADVPYRDTGAGIRNELDLYVARTRRAAAPVLIYIHGGAWTHGKKDQQGLPIVYHFASRGWLCVQPNYRLCPDATFPDQIVDIKRAIAWVHEHAHEYGGDPQQIFLTGGSAGGHLSALAALTMNDPTLQPGFEDADTSVVAAMSLYGDYDWLDSNTERAQRGLDRSKYFADKIVKCAVDTDRATWERGSPLLHVRADAPPFFVVHGARDTMLLVEDARHFAAALQSISRSPVAYAELPGAQHAFDGFQSVRCGSVINAMEWFTAWVRTTRLRVV
jgi:acetyl esterase/lipase